MRTMVRDAAGTPEAEPPAQGVTLSIPTHMVAPSHALVLREGPKPTRPRGRIPRVAGPLARAHYFQELLDTHVVETSRVRRTRQAHPGARHPDYDPAGAGRQTSRRRSSSCHRDRGLPTIIKRDLRAVLKTVVWSEQR